MVAPGERAHRPRGSAVDEEHSSKLKAYGRKGSRLSTIAFEVRGLPIPQGSTRAWVVNGKPIITSTAKGLGSWRRLVADVAQQFAPPDLWNGPIRLELTFGLPKPKSAPKTRRVWPDKRPDLDKLVRAVLDALTHIVFSDDAQIVELHATKEYGPPGVWIEIHRVLEDSGARPG